MSAPLVVNTRDGLCWTRRTVTPGGIALYAPESVQTCPNFVMATLAELAEHGIAGSADALPLPVGPEPLLSTRTRELVEMEGDRNRWKAEAEELRARLAEYERPADEDDATPQVAKLRARVAELEAQRAALAVRLRSGQRWKQGRRQPLVSQDYVSQDELRAIFGIALTAPWDSPAEDPCHPCGCPKRFDRHADGCPTVAAEADGITRRLAPTQALRAEAGGAPC